MNVYNAAIDFISWNFEAVSLKDDFVTFDLNVLNSFLRSSNLVIKDEYTLFGRVCAWLAFHEQHMVLDEFAILVPRVVNNIRFTMMTQRQLANLLVNPLVVKFKDIFVERMSNAMSFHVGHIGATKR